LLYLTVAGLDRAIHLLLSFPRKRESIEDTVTLDEFRHEMEAYREDAEQTASALKDTNIVLERLNLLYKRFDADERELANQVVSEWVLAEDENLRFDAAHLIREFKIVSAITSLQILIERLSSDSAPSAPFERASVDRLLHSLAP
jgi:hypothetical protein